MKKHIPLLLLLAILASIIFSLIADCPAFDPFEYPRWPENDNLVFDISQTNMESFILRMKNWKVYDGAVMYMRTTMLDPEQPTLVHNEYFDSGANVSRDGEMYVYPQRDFMFTNTHYQSIDNGDCSVNTVVQFPIQEILNQESSEIQVRRATDDVIQTIIPFYYGYAVPSRQTGNYWQYQENMFRSVALINTLVSTGEIKTTINAACSSTIKGGRGVIMCSYASGVDVYLINPSSTTINSGPMIVETYNTVSAGRTYVEFQTIEPVNTKLEGQIQIDGLICRTGLTRSCASESNYRAVSPFSFTLGGAQVEISFEAELIFSMSISDFTVEGSDKTIIGASPKFWILVRTNSPKSTFRVASGTNKLSVQLTHQPKYFLASYPEFPVANTVRYIFENDFPDELPDHVKNSSYVQYIIEFDNNKERYSRATESPMLFKVSFNLEGVPLLRRRVNDDAQSVEPKSLSVSAILSPACSLNPDTCSTTAPSLSNTAIRSMQPISWLQCIIALIVTLALL